MFYAQCTSARGDCAYGKLTLDCLLDLVARDGREQQLRVGDGGGGVWELENSRDVVSEVVYFNCAALAAVRADHEDPLKRDARRHIRPDVCGGVPDQTLHFIGHLRRCACKTIMID